MGNNVHHLNFIEHIKQIGVFEIYSAPNFGIYLDTLINCVSGAANAGILLNQDPFRLFGFQVQNFNAEVAKLYNCLQQEKDRLYRFKFAINCLECSSSNLTQEHTPVPTIDRGTKREQHKRDSRIRVTTAPIASCTVGPQRVLPFSQTRRNREPEQHSAEPIYQSVSETIPEEEEPRPYPGTYDPITVSQENANENQANANANERHKLTAQGLTNLIKRRNEEARNREINQIILDRDDASQEAFQNRIQAIQELTLNQKGARPFATENYTSATKKTGKKSKNNSFGTKAELDLIFPETINVPIGKLITNASYPVSYRQGNGSSVLETVIQSQTTEVEINYTPEDRIYENTLDEEVNNNPLVINENPNLKKLLNKRN